MTSTTVDCDGPRAKRRRTDHASASHRDRAQGPNDSSHPVGKAQLEFRYMYLHGHFISMGHSNLSKAFTMDIENESNRNEQQTASNRSSSNSTIFSKA